MLLQILQHTPTWVFALFAGLVYLGIAQRKPRVVSRARLAVLPLAMMTLSFMGVWSSFGANPIALSAWACVLVAVVAGSLALTPSRRSACSPETKLYSVPGSWIPLTLMMCIFFSKYAIAVVRATNPEAANGPVSTGAICALYGLYSGLFLARALRVARSALQPTTAAAIDIRTN